jgi:hypothetical protein
VLLEEIRMKSLKGRLIGGEDLHCEDAMVVWAIVSSFLVPPVPNCLYSLLETKGVIKTLCFRTEFAFRRIYFLFLSTQVNALAKLILLSPYIEFY